MCQEKVTLKTSALPQETKNGVMPSSHLALASLGIGTFAQITCEFLPVGLLTQIAGNFSISQGQAGLMMTIPGFFAGIAAAAIASVSGKADRKSVLLVLAALLAISSVICATAVSYNWILFGRAILGLSLGGSWAISLSVAARVAAPGKVNQAAAAVFAGVTAAMILGLPIGTMIANATSWRYAFAIGAVLGVVALIMQTLCLPQLPAQESFKPAKLWKFLAEPGALSSLAMVAVGHAAHFGAYTYLAPAMQDGGISGYSLTPMLLGFGVIGFAANFIASTLVKRRLLATLVASQILLAATVGFLFVTNIVTVRLGLILGWGVAWGMLPLALNMWHRRVRGGGGEAGSALFIVTSQISIALGAMIGGLMLDRLNLYATYGAMALLSFLGAVIALKVRNKSSY